MVTVGVALIGYAVGSRFGGAESVTVGFAVALGAVGLCLVGIGLAGRRVGAAALPVWALVIALVAANGHGADLTTGDQVWKVTSAQASTRSLGAGDATLDLSGLKATDAQGQTIAATVRFGQLTIIRPDTTVPVVIQASAGLGEIDLPGGDQPGGFSINRFVPSGPSTATDPNAIIIVRAEVGVGAIIVKDPG